MPFEVPEGWEWVRLGELAFYKKGPFGSSLTKSMFVPKSETSYKVYEQKNAINKDETLGNYYIPNSKFEELKGFEVFSNDIIVSCAGTIGETFVLPNDIELGIINQALMIIRLFDKRIQPFYLLYFDFVLKEYAKNEGKGTAIKNIPPFDVLRNYLIPLPPLTEQDRIISEINNWLILVEIIELNKSDLQSTIQKTKQKVLDLAIRGKLVPQDPNDEPVSELFDKIKTKKTTDIFPYPFEVPEGWMWCRLGEIVEINPKNLLDDELDVSFVPMTMISDKFSNNHVSETRKWKEIKKGFTHFREGDIGVAKITPCFENRKSVIFANLTNKYGAGTTELHILRPYSKLFFSQYLLWFVKSGYFIDNGISNFTGAVGQQRVGKNIIESTPFPLPKIAEQKRIVTQIEKIFSQLDQIEEALKA